LITHHVGLPESTVVSILVVDDSATERVRISGLLARKGTYQVLTTADGQQALDLIEDTAVDLVLTDLQMPVMNGLDLVREIRSRFPAIPVVLMTGAGSEEIAVQAMQEGAASYVRKSSRPGWVTDAIDRVLAARARKLSQSRLLKHQCVDEYEFSLHNSRALMSSTSRFLRQAAQAMSICSEKDLLRFGIALEEALLNACLHGNLELDSTLREQEGTAFEETADDRSARHPWQDRKVTVSAAFTRQQAKIEVSDEGSGFNPQSLPDPTDPENLLKPHGRGVMMMRLFMDEILWNEEGNQVTLIRNAEES
jgi:CheY-like chemotaxis protein/anti-sigma regulatory factor (Ser/Thr protein kinase)